MGTETPQTSNLFADLPADVPDELFQTLLTAEKPPRPAHRLAQPRLTENFWYDQNEHEWVLLVRGAGPLALEGEEPLDLTPGSFVNIPAHRRHRVDWTDPAQPTIWLAIHYSSSERESSRILRVMTIPYNGAMQNRASSPPTPLRADLPPPSGCCDRVTFLNHGSFGAVPRCVFDAQAEWRRRIEAEPIELLGRGGTDLLAEAEGADRGLLGIRPEDFGFVTNATEGVNAVLRSLELQAGRRMLTTTHVYNAVRQAMRHVAHGRAQRSRGGRPAAVDSADEIADESRSAPSPPHAAPGHRPRHVATALGLPGRADRRRAAARGGWKCWSTAHTPGMLRSTSRGSAPRITPATCTSGSAPRRGAASCGSGRTCSRPSTRWSSATSRRRVSPGVRLAGDAQHCSGWLTRPGGARHSWRRSAGRTSCAAQPRAGGLGPSDALRAWGVEPLSPLDGSLLGSMGPCRCPDRWRHSHERSGGTTAAVALRRSPNEVPVMQWSGRTSAKAAVLPGLHPRGGVRAPGRGGRVHRDEGLTLPRIMGFQPMLAT